MCNVHTYVHFHWDAVNIHIFNFLFLNHQGVQPSDIMIDINQLEFNGRFLLEDKVYQIIGMLPSPVRKTNIVVERKKVEIVLYKEEVGVSWERLDIAMDANGHFVEKSLGLRKGTLVSCSDVTHNTKLFTFSLPKGSYLNVPTGHHVQLWAELNGTLTTYNCVVQFSFHFTRPPHIVCIIYDTYYTHNYITSLYYRYYYYHCSLTVFGYLKFFTLCVFSRHFRGTCSSQLHACLYAPVNV